MPSLVPVLRREAPLPLKKALQSLCRQARIQFNSFLAAACTWTKTLLALQEWGLCAYGPQTPRAAECRQSKKWLGHFFDGTSAPKPFGALFCPSQVEIFLQCKK